MERFCDIWVSNLTCVCYIYCTLIKVPIVQVKGIFVRVCSHLLQIPTMKTARNVRQWSQTRPRRQMRRLHSSQGPSVAMFWWGSTMLALLVHAMPVPIWIDRLVMPSKHYVRYFHLIDLLDTLMDTPVQPLQGIWCCRSWCEYQVSEAQSWINLTIWKCTAVTVVLPCSNSISER